MCTPKSPLPAPYMSSQGGILPADTIQHAPRALDTWGIAAWADTLGGRGTTRMTPWSPKMRRGGQCVARDERARRWNLATSLFCKRAPLRPLSKTLGGRGERRVGEAGGQQQAGRGHPPSTQDDSRLDTLGEEQERAPHPSATKTRCTEWAKQRDTPF